MKMIFSVVGTTPDWNFLLLGLTVEALTLEIYFSFFSLVLLILNFLDIGAIRGVNVQSFISLITLERSYFSKGLFY